MIGADFIGYIGVLILFYVQILVQWGYKRSNSLFILWLNVLISMLLLLNALCYGNSPIIVLQIMLLLVSTVGISIATNKEDVS